MIFLSLHQLQDFKYPFSVMKKLVIETIIDRIWLVNSNANIFFGRCLECKNPDALTRYILLGKSIYKNKKPYAIITKI